MPRTMTAAVKAELAAGVVRPVLFVEGEFSSGTLRLFTGLGQFTWNGQTWFGSGELLDVDELGEAGAISATGINISLSGIPSNILTSVLDEIRQGRAVKIWMGFYTEAGALIADPALAWAGRIDTGSLEEGGENSTARITVENHLIDLQRDGVGETLESLVDAGAGHLVWSGGKWKLFGGAWRGPVLTLGDGQFLAPLAVRTARSRRDLFNSVKVVFASPAHNYQPTDAPAVSVAGYVTEDGGEKIWTDIAAPWTTSPARAQRLARIFLERTRRQKGVTLRAALEAWELVPPDIFGITHARFGWTGKTFRADKVSLAMESDDQGVKIPGVNIECEEEDADIYAWNPATDEGTMGTGGVVVIPNPYPVAAPTDVALLNVTILRVDGVRQTAVRVSWTPPEDQMVLSGGRFEIQWRRTGDPDTAWRHAGSPEGDRTVHAFSGPDDGDQIDVRIRALNAAGVPSPWAMVSAFGVTGEGFGHHTYRPLTNPLTATDAGASATVSVAAFTMRVQGVGDLAVSSGSVTSLAFNTLYYIFYDDPTFEGGAVTFQATTSREEALDAPGRFFVGSIRTPADGAADTVGNNDGGVGAQTGGHVRNLAGAAAFGSGGTQQNLGNAIDGDWATFARHLQGPNISSLVASVTASQFRPFSEPDRFYTDLKLKVKAAANVVNESDAAGTSTLRVRYSTNGGVGWTDIRTATAAGAGASANLAAQVDTVSLPDGTDPSKVRVEVRGEGHTGGANNDGSLGADLYEAELEGDY